jgi:hypothetical protein
MNGKVENSYSRNPFGGSKTGKVLPQRHRTRMTEIARIFTDMWACRVELIVCKVNGISSVSEEDHIG